MQRPDGAANRNASIERRHTVAPRTGRFPPHAGDDRQRDLPGERDRRRATQAKLGGDGPKERFPVRLREILINAEADGGSIWALYRWSRALGKRAGETPALHCRSHADSRPLPLG